MFDHRVALVIGTRPEAIKLSPVARALTERGVLPRIVLTGQHPGLDPAAFGLDGYPRSDFFLPGQSDPYGHAQLVSARIPAAIGEAKLVVVQGDTSSALGGAIGAAEAGVPVAHVEAGLRSHDRANPWPEEDFRIAIDRQSALLFAPTRLSAANLQREGVRGWVTVTGNTGIDALFERIPKLPQPVDMGGGLRLLVTCHRRESWGEGLESIADCLREIADRGHARITMVLHTNPQVANGMRRMLGGRADILLQEPCTHAEMVRLMIGSDLILSDSGGMQEEAPALGVPLLILRDRTERPEAVMTGNSILVGRKPERILEVAEHLIGDRDARTAMSRPALPFGDGRAARRIAASIEEWLQTTADRPYNLGQGRVGQSGVEAANGVAR